MKNRKTVVVAFLLVAVLLLGVGYAALTDALNINGRANVTTGKAEEALNEDVYFSAAVAVADDPNSPTKGTSGVANTASILQDKDRASFTVNSLALGGETANFAFTVKNESNHEVTLSYPTITITDLIGDGVDDAASDSGVFTVTMEWADAETDGTAILAAGGEKVLNVTVTLYQAGTNPEYPVTGVFDINFTATAH